MVRMRKEREQSFLASRFFMYFLFTATKDFLTNEPRWWHAKQVLAKWSPFGSFRWWHRFDWVVGHRTERRLIFCKWPPQWCLHRRFALQATLLKEHLWSQFQKGWPQRLGSTRTLQRFSHTKNLQEINYSISLFVPMLLTCNKWSCHTLSQVSPHVHSLS